VPAALTKPQRLRSKDKKEAQQNTALWLIDNLAIRAGNEKDTSEEARPPYTSSSRPHTLVAEGLIHEELKASYTSSLGPHTEKDISVVKRQDPYQICYIFIMYRYVYVCVCVCVCVCVYIYRYRYIFTHVYIYTCVRER
jgi:hypothetical protein